MNDGMVEMFAYKNGEAAASNYLARAKIYANAKAAMMLAARECPPDIIEWGRRHGIPTFAEVTWWAGFQAGMRVMALDGIDKSHTKEAK